MIQIHHVQRVMALLVIVFAHVMLLPALVALHYGDGGVAAFLLSYGLSLALGLGFWWPVRHRRGELRNRDGFLIVGATWIVLGLISSLPILLSGMSHSLTDAMFETISGLTTTGSTVFTQLDTLPHALNFWRHLLDWLGGMGIIVLAVAILPLLGVGGRQLFKAETPGPLKDASLTPRITGTAKALWLVYAGLTILCGLAYWWAGMTPFDAVNHALSTLSLGGFSTHDASFAYFKSPLIEGIAMVFMLIAGMNFATHFLALRERSLRVYRLDPEVIGFLGVVLAGIAVATLYLWWRGTYPDFLSALRFASFNVISIATTTGFASTDYNLWPIFVPLLMLALSCFATSAGSTGGGIKMVRAILLYRQGLREIQRLTHPAAEVPVKLAGRRMPEQVLTAVWGFFFLYIGVIALTTLALAATGLDFNSAFSAVIASINNMGPGLNLVGPASNYGGLSSIAKWILIFTMILGRLEIYTFLILFTPSFWRY